MLFFLGMEESLLFGFVNSGLKENDTLIIPGYMCDTTIQPLRNFGFKIEFMDVNDNLNLTPSRVIKKIREHNAKGIVLVHYFGFRYDFNEIINFCISNNIIVAEDWSHSFLSCNAPEVNKIQSSFMISSARKILPVLDGGMLFIDSNKLVDKRKEHPVSTFKIFLYLSSRAIEKLLTFIGINIYSANITKLKNVFER